MMRKHRDTNEPGRLAKRFALRLSNHIGATRSDLATSAETLLQQITEAVAVREWDDDPSELVKITGRMLVRLALMTDIRTTLLRCSSSCESPIELVLCFSLGIAAKMRGIAVLYDFGSIYSGDADGDMLLRIQPQVVLCGARVDFLLTLQKTLGSEGINVWRKQLVIECDGAKYHDELPEQGARDRKRDRTMVALGLQVMRFSGSEIWKDSFECARQVLESLECSIESQEAAWAATVRKPIARVHSHVSSTDATA